MIEHLTRRARAAGRHARHSSDAPPSWGRLYSPQRAPRRRPAGTSRALEATLSQLTNGARANNGLRVLQQNGTLVGLARWRSKDEVQRNYFSHTILGSGYEVYHWVRHERPAPPMGWREHRVEQWLRRCRSPPVKIHEGFMASPGHRANILEPSWTTWRRRRLRCGQRELPRARPAARASIPSCSCRRSRPHRHRHPLHRPARIRRRHPGADRRSASPRVRHRRRPRAMWT